MGRVGVSCSLFFALLTMLFGFLAVLIAILALMLVGVVLLQSGKGGGLAGIASTGTTQILGARQAPDVLEKATWVIGGLFIVLCILTVFTLDTSTAERSVLQDANVQTGTPAAPRTPAPAPVNPASPTNSGPATPAAPTQAPR